MRKQFSLQAVMFLITGLCIGFVGGRYDRWRTINSAEEIITQLRNELSSLQYATTPIIQQKGPLLIMIDSESNFRVGSSLNNPYGYRFKTFAQAQKFVDSWNKPEPKVSRVTLVDICNNVRLQIGVPYVIFLTEIRR